MNRIEKSRRDGFAQGVAWAVATLYRLFDETRTAEILMAESDIPMVEFRKAGVEEYDRKILRKVSPTRRGRNTLS